MAGAESGRRGYALDAPPQQFRPQDVGPLGGVPLIDGTATRTLEAGEFVDLLDGTKPREVIGVSNGTAYIDGWSPGRTNTLSPFGGGKQRQVEISSRVRASQQPIRRKP